MLRRSEILRILSRLTDRFSCWELAHVSRLSQAKGTVVDPHRELVLDILKQLGVFRKLGDDKKSVRKDEFGRDKFDGGSHESYWYSERLPNGVTVDVEFHVDPDDNNATDIFVLNGDDGDVFGQLFCEDIEDIAPVEIDKIREFLDVAARQEPQREDVVVSAGYCRASRRRLASSFEEGVPQDYVDDVLSFAFTRLGKTVDLEQRELNDFRRGGGDGYQACVEFIEDLYTSGVGPNAAGFELAAFMMQNGIISSVSRRGYSRSYARRPYRMGRGY